MLEQKIRLQQKPIIHFLDVVVFEKPLNFEAIATEAKSRGVDFWSPHHHHPHLQLFIGAGTSSDAAKNLDTDANELTVLHLNYLPPGAIGLLVKCEEPH